jgi:hypothetical protein
LVRDTDTTPAFLRKGAQAIENKRDLFRSLAREGKCAGTMEENGVISRQFSVESKGGRTKPIAVPLPGKKSGVEQFEWNQFTLMRVAEKK